MTDRLDSTTSGSQSNEPRPGRWPRWIVPLVVAGILAVQLPMLATTLDDIDPFNFALGVRDFDPRRHQPHPPGYPIYIALAKVSTAVIDAARPEPMRGGRGGAAQCRAGARVLERDLRRAGGRALLRAVPPAVRSGRRRAAWGGGAGRLRTRRPPQGSPPGSGGDRSNLYSARRLAAGAVLLAVASPLFWFTCLRPLSDVPGLVAAVGRTGPDPACVGDAGARRRGWRRRARVGDGRPGHGPHRRHPIADPLAHAAAARRRPPAAAPRPRVAQRRQRDWRPDRGRADRGPSRW